MAGDADLLEESLLLEAHAPDAFHERVGSLHQGEVARLQGGVAVKRLALEDGRDAFRVAGPRSWGSGEVRFDDYGGDTHRTADEATRAAFRKSAESTDPESLGGANRLTRWAPYEDGGSEVRVQDYTLDGRVVVSAPGQSGATRTVHPDTLVRKNPLLASLEEAEVGKPGTNWKQVSPENRKKVDPLVKHWMGHAHPFTACVNELAPEKGMEAAKRICAVVKDMGMKSTKWRKGGQKVKEEVVAEFTGRLLEAARGDVACIEKYLLRDIVIAEAEAKKTVEVAGGDPIEKGKPDWAARRKKKLRDPTLAL